MPRLRHRPRRRQAGTRHHRHERPDGSALRRYSRLFFEEIAPKLGPTYQKRPGVERLAGKNDLTALVAFNGTQQIRDRNLKPAYLAKDGCGEASLTIGNIRVTVCDRDSATRVAKALADAYGEAAATYARLRPFEDLRDVRDVRRVAHRERRKIRI